ncbi:hypothetical protein SAMN02745126_02257 [Enhydrobacter aerosaccus]|uniref:Uncharacterized protein n=1 Tax=Enhydrobacter aerosaccus TaxID=225324 RepID=A0A1T4NEW1_9HYPH|nr:hypothetical protein [Enhydrobacter aerosaccus]SJZ77800.1 hypothetical protein SAMN02745126_02257 [Enhydrobacter aerosaccus]
MIRFIVRIFLSPLAIAIFDLMILFPLLLAIWEVAHSGWKHEQGLHEALDIIEGMGVILIGWGVALEERESLRHIFRLTGNSDEGWQAIVDHMCHSAGLGLLIFGLFAEMCIEAIRLPNAIINTAGIDHLVLLGSLAFLVLSIYVMVHHIFSLIRALFAGKHVVSSQSPSH